MKKKIYLYLIAALCFCGNSFGQDRHDVKLDPNFNLIDAVSINNGLVLLTGPNYYDRSHLNWKISYYTPHLSKRYEVAVTGATASPRFPRAFGSFNYGGQLSNSVSDVFYPGFLVVSPGGNNVYYITHGEGTMFSGSTNTQKITRIDSVGLASSLTMKSQLKYKQVNVVFADDAYLYYVTKDKVKHKRHHQAKPKLHFIRVDKANNVSTIDLKLPEPDEDATEWSYLGNTGIVSYFTSRTIDDDYKKQTFRVAVIDHNGNLQDDFKMDMSIKQGGFMPAFNYCGNDGAHVVDNHNIKVVVQTSTYNNYAAGTSTTTTRESHTPYPEAFGNIMLDPITNGFYIYGLTGMEATSKRAKRRMKSGVGDPAEYYVFKFDQDGKQLWSYEGKLTGVDEDYKTRTRFDGRSLKLSYGAEGVLRFQTFAHSYPRWFSLPENNVYTYEFNPSTGKYATYYANTFENQVTPFDLGSCRKAGDKSDFGKFQSKAAKGDYSQFNFRMINNNILVRNFYKDGRLEMYDFSDE